MDDHVATIVLYPRSGPEIVDLPPADVERVAKESLGWWPDVITWCGRCFIRNETRDYKPKGEIAYLEARQVAL